MSGSKRRGLPSGTLRVGNGMLILLILGSGSVRAQTPVAGLIKPPVVNKHDIRFVRLSANGEPIQSRVTAIVQDDYGFLWFGTGDGLYKYDGYHFKPYRHQRGNPNSVADDGIRALCKDRTGILWIGSKYGLDRLDPASDRFTHYRHETGKPATLGGESVFSAYQDSRGQLWIGTGDGLDRMIPGTATFVHYRHNPGDPASISGGEVRVLYEDRRGNLWVGTVLNGLDKLDQNTGHFSHFQHDAHNPRSIGNNYVAAILEDHFGVLWVASSLGSGLSALDMKTNEFSRYSFHEEEPSDQSVAGLTSLFEDRDGALWLSAIDRGLIRFDPNRKEFFRYANEPGNPDSLPSDTIYAVFEDAEGEMWAGSQNGICRFQRKSAFFMNYSHRLDDRNSLRNNMVWSAQADSHGSLWIGDDEGVDQLNLQSGQFTFYQHDAKNPASLSYNKVIAISEDSSGALWFGTYGGGLDRFDRATGRFRAYRHDSRNSGSLSSDAVLSLLVDAQGTLWAGTQGGGLNRFDAVTGRFTAYFNDPLSPGSVSDILFEDQARVLWIGTPDQGLIRFDPEANRFVQFRHNSADAQSLSSNKVNAIREDRLGRLWVGTEDGLNLLEQNRGVFTVFTVSEGLPDNAIESILEDGHGYLWLGTHSGLSRFDPGARTFTNYSESDGLAGNLMDPYGAGGSCKTPQGELVFASSRGVTIFNPDRMSHNSYVPPVRFTELRLSNKPVNPGKGSPLSSQIWATNAITLNHDQNIFALDFAALSYTAPLRNRYRYRLEGFDQNWSEADSGGRTATYTNLPARTYTFRVQGSNNDGVWNTEGVALAITVLPPWWETWWFRSLLGLTAAVLAWTAYQARIRQLNLRFEDRLAERTRIAQELHDTLIQDMVAVGLQLDIIEDQIPGEPNAAQNTLNVVQSRVRQLVSRGRHTLSDLRSASASTKDLIESLSQAGRDLRAGETPRFHASAQGDHFELHSLIWHELDRVGREAITNAFRHAHAKSIDVELTGVDHSIQLVVRDDGCGMDTKLVSEGRPGHFGLPGMRERVARVGGGLTLRSRPGAGTEVSVIIPLRDPRKTGPRKAKI